MRTTESALNPLRSGQTSLPGTWSKALLGSMLPSTSSEASAAYPRFEQIPARDPRASLKREPLAIRSSRGASLLQCLWFVVYLPQCWARLCWLSAADSLTFPPDSLC